LFSHKRRPRAKAAATWVAVLEPLLLAARIPKTFENEKEKSMHNPLPTKQPYNPGGFLDAIAKRLNARTDAELSRRLNIQAPLLSKIRAQTCPVGASLLIRIQEVTGLQITEMRSLMGDQRARFRIGARYLSRRKYGRDDIPGVLIELKRRR
jgi:hypothetical protein